LAWFPWLIDFRAPKIEKGPLNTFRGKIVLHVTSIVC
jgi:hypothetical protein